MWIRLAVTRAGLLDEPGMKDGPYLAAADLWPHREAAGTGFQLQTAQEIKARPWAMHM